MKNSRKSAFSLAELIVVIGIIALLIAILMPVVTTARKQAKTLKCQANLRTIGQLLVMYANENRGWIYPVGDGDPLAPAGPGNLRRLGGALPPEQRWPVYVKGLRRWDSPLLLCPADEQPADAFSYTLNYWLQAHSVRFNAANLPTGVTASEMVLMSEKKESLVWYFFADADEYEDGADPYKHSISQGCNYLFLDLHVAQHRPGDVNWGFDLPQS